MSDTTLAEASLTLPPDRGYHPSPVDWRDEVMYSILIDRFSATENGVIVGDASSGRSRHGGTIAGVTQRLGYLRELGVSTVVLSPVTMTAPDTYHGYAPINLLAVEPALGTLTDLVTLVDTAHEHGLRVILDLLVNHVGRVFDYVGGNDWRGRSGPPAQIEKWRLPLWPAELAQADHFTRRGTVNDWSDPDQAALGDFPGHYRRLATDNPDTRRILTRIACWWLARTDVDGFRIDAIRHIDQGFVATLIVDLKKFAATIGKDNFLILGECSNSSDRLVADCYDLGVDSLYAYPEYRRQNWALHGRAPARDLADSAATALAVLGPRQAYTVRFIDNQDVYRFLRDGEPLPLLRLGLAFLLLSSGIPALYYGTEQGFRQHTANLEHESRADPADPDNREDMFAGGLFVSDSSRGDRFDTTSVAYQWTRELIELRRRYPALRRGDQVTRYADPDGPGLYAFSRLDDGAEVLVVLNTSAGPRQAFVGLGPDSWVGVAEVADALDPAHVVAVSRAAEGAPIGITAAVPGHGVAVFVSPTGAATG